MSMKKGDILELDIEGMAAGGMGVARINRYVVFVKGGVPGGQGQCKDL